MKIIKVTSCMSCPERDIIRTGKNMGKFWCGLSQRLLPDTLSGFPEWCALDDQPSNFVNSLVACRKDSRLCLYFKGEDSCNQFCEGYERR